MPELDGRALYQELIKIGHPAQHRLLLITGDTLNQHTIAFLEKSKLPHLAKPFLVEELKTMVSSLLGQARAEAGP
jgi:DNA-binding response OmpR family regulator